MTPTAPARLTIMLRWSTAEEQLLLDTAPSDPDHRKLRERVAARISNCRSGRDQLVYVNSDQVPIARSLAEDAGVPYVIRDRDGSILGEWPTP